MLIRHKHTDHVLQVPDEYNPAAFPDYEPVENEAAPASPRRSGAKGSGSPDEAGVPTE